MTHAACPIAGRAAYALLPSPHYSARPVRDVRTTRQQENAVKFFNRLAHREFLVLAAVAASALTLHIRQESIDAHARSTHVSRAEYGRICEPPVAHAQKGRVLPADCAIRANVQPNRPNAPWV
jgi:hypothetical protein